MAHHLVTTGVSVTHISKELKQVHWIRQAKLLCTSIILLKIGLSFFFLLTTHSAVSIKRTIKHHC